MAGFKQPDFIERQQAAAKARKAALERFLAKAADPALAERLTERTASAAGRKAVKTVRDAEKAEKKVRDAALQAERAKVEKADREATLQAENKAARDARYAARKSRSRRK
jgi:hypothetical protein